jgi:hypothetical protein
LTTQRYRLLNRRRFLNRNRRKTSRHRCRNRLELNRQWFFEAFHAVFRIRLRRLRNRVAQADLDRGNFPLDKKL